MVQPGFGDLDTPRTNIGDATYLSRQPDFDMSQEASFQTPVKETNLLQQLRNGRPGGISLRTPRGRGPFTDRRNLPAGIGGAEFTPMLKSATRNSARRPFGKENGVVPNTPALDRIDEDLTPIPGMDTSIYTSRNVSYMDKTLPEVDSSSTASTPMVLLPRRGDKGPLHDGNQLSLREQENVIDKIEKENFGLKLKIHFLEEALRKTGPGFSEAALKENTDLKVDKVTMQRELHRYKKHLTTAEKDLESYRQQMLELQEKAKRKYADDKQLAEIERLRQIIEEKDSDIEDLQRQLDRGQDDQGQVDKLQDEVGDLEADVREKDRIISEHEDEIEELKSKLDAAEDTMKSSQRRMIELEEKAQTSDELEEAKDTIDDLDRNVRRLEEQVDDMKEKLEQAVSAKDRAEGDLEELQDELANKSMVTKGLSRQIEEKVVRLQTELEESDTKFATLESQHSAAVNENDDLKSKIKEGRRDRDASERDHQALLAKVDELRTELQSRVDEKNVLQTRHESLTAESASLQRDVSRLQKSVDDLEDSLAQEREHALEIEKDIRSQYRGEIDRLNDEISDLQAETREKDNLYDNDSEKWETERQTLESERDRAEEKAAGLQRTIDKLREVEGTLSNKESKMQEAIQSETERHKNDEAILSRQIEDLQQNLEARQSMLTDLRSELSAIQDELRQTQLDYQSQTERVEALEDEVEVLQTTLDDESEHSREELEAARRECEALKQQLDLLRKSAITNSSDSDAASRSNASIERLQSQLADATAQVARVSREKQTLQDQLANLNLDLHSLRSTLAETKAERDEVENELKRTQHHGEETFRIDQERLDLRTSKLKLDNEVRRLKDENRALSEQRQSVEKTLEEEIEKSAEEEERLNQEILQLQSKLRQSSSAEGQESSSARRTIRELERRIEDYESQLATVNLPHGNAGDGGDVSLIRRDLSAARQKELEYLQRESAHKDVVKSLKRQITDLERKAHEAEMARLIMSPESSTASGRKTDVSELRHQLSAAHQSTHELKTKARDAERKVGQVERDFQSRLEALEDQKIALEQALEDAQLGAEEAAALHDKAMRRLNQKLEKSERERKSAASTGHGDKLSSGERHDVRGILRKMQTEADALEHDVVRQQETIDTLMASEAALRTKLDRARSERAVYRITAEKLQKDIRELKAGAGNRQMVRFVGEKSLKEADTAIDTIIRAAEGAEDRHAKELRGMTMQMEWMQARWERECSMRADAGYAKKFLQLELGVANACNKAQLRELEQIRCDLLGSRRPLPIPSGARHERPTFKAVAVMARFIARLQISARAWSKHEAKRQRLAECVDEMRKEKRRKGLKVVMA